MVLGHWRAALAVIGAPVFIGVCIYAAILVDAASRGEVWTVLPDWLESTSKTLKSKPGPFDDLMPAQKPDQRWQDDPKAVALMTRLEKALRKADALKPLRKPEQDRVPQDR